MKVFIAASLFSQAEREFNEKVDKILRSSGFDTILPQRDVGDLWDKLKKHGKRAYKEVYRQDLKALESCDEVVALLDGNDGDCGVAFEMGYGRALGKPIIGLKTDVRKVAEKEEVNNMIAKSVVKIVRDVQKLPVELRKLFGGQR